MKENDLKYSAFALCKEMMETVEIIGNFNPEVSLPYVSIVQQIKRILIAGEGSSRIFPGKHLRDLSLKFDIPYAIVTEGALQSMEYNLEQQVVFGVSNSGKTKEVVALFNYLNEKSHTNHFGVTATLHSTLTQLSNNHTLLKCGKELAVAATKSVVEQTLFFESLLLNLLQQPMQNLTALALDFKHTLEVPIASGLIEKMSNAPLIYFSGRNNGVAEELALKTNEITRKKSTYLQGTYALHGIEEVMKEGEVLVIIEPFEQEEQKFLDVLQKGAGIEIIAISSRNTLFPTIKIPKNKQYNNYIELAAGWNLLVETGLNLGLDIDKPTRARKVGNEA